MKCIWKTCILGLSSGLMSACGEAVDAKAVASSDEHVASVQQRETLDCSTYDSQIPSIKWNQELMIIDPRVVNDANNNNCRTEWGKSGCPTGSAKWSFWYLMSQMAGTNDVSRFVLKWLESFEESPVVNFQSLSTRQKIRGSVIDPWRQASGCSIGLKVDQAPCPLNGGKAPFRLLAIVNRTDLRVPSGSNGYGSGAAGEGRIVFGFKKQDAAGTPLQATVIFEYKLPTSFSFPTPTPFDWAYMWHGLGQSTTFDAAYNNQLQNITDRFTSAGVNTSGFNNGSAISQVRVNEIDFDVNTLTPPGDDRQWSLREFRLGCLPSNPSCGTNDRYLVPVTVAQTPATSFNDTSVLTDYLNQSKGFYGPSGSGILGEANSIPDDYSFNGSIVHFRGAESKSIPFIPGKGTFWKGSTPLNDPSTAVDVRRLFALATCNGCHYFETQTNNFHIGNRSANARAQLSSFLTQDPTDPLGSSAGSPNSAGDPVYFNEPRRRVCEFLSLLDFNLSPLSNTSGRTH